MVLTKAEAGYLGGRVTSEKKAAASRENGKLGGRPTGSKKKPTSKGPEHSNQALKNVLVCKFCGSIVMEVNPDIDTPDVIYCPGCNGNIASSDLESKIV